METFIANLCDVIENKPFKAKFQNNSIVIYKSSKGVFAVEDRCSHEEYPLSESDAEDDKIECKKHGSVFSLSDGRALNLPALYPIKTYKVLIKEEKIYIID